MSYHHDLELSHHHHKSGHMLQKKDPQPQFGGDAQAPWGWAPVTVNPQPTQHAHQGNAGMGQQQQQQQQQEFSNPFDAFQSFRDSQASAAAASASAAAQQQQQQQSQQQFAQQQQSSQGGPNFFDAGNSNQGIAQGPAASPTQSFAGVAGPPVQGVAGPPVRGQSQSTQVPATPSVSSHAVSSSADGTSNSSDGLVRGPSATSSGDISLETPFNSGFTAPPTGVAAGVASPSSSTNASNTSDEGMSGGAKAGLAFGIIIIVALVAGLLFFCIRRKKSKKNAHQKLQDEKTGLHNQESSITSHVSINKSKTAAPRLSLRPVTEMFPNEKQEMSSTGTAQANVDKRSGASSHSSNEPLDPFGDHAATPRELDTNAVSGSGSGSGSGSETSSTDLVAPAPLRIKDERKPLEDRSGAASPAMSQRGIPGPAANNVHRVQLDFKPSMEDELELKAGQVIRMLHEYDDGWALCIRLDRSQQGVVPRSCLSKLPIKPRPNGPPPGNRGPVQGSRPRGPASNSPHPPSPSGSMSSHSGDPRTRAPPPEANGRNRSQSNAAYGGSPKQGFNGYNGLHGLGQSADRPRSNSASLSPRRVNSPQSSSVQDVTSSTNGSSIPSRKPVPGQAV